MFAVPTFATAITWKSPEWSTTFETLKGAEAFLGIELTAIEMK